MISPSPTSAPPAAPGGPAAAAGAPGRQPRLSAPRRAANIAGVAIPPIALIVGGALGWQRILDWQDLAMMGVFYVLPILGVTVGFHRLLTHRSFAVHRATEYAFAVLGSMAVQGPVIKWVADHRKHHAFSDRDGDPHSPHTDHGPGLRGALRGLWHAHVGWLFSTVGLADARRYAKDLVEDPVMRAISRGFAGFTALTLLLPFAIGWLYAGTLTGALWALVWAGLVRVFLIHHTTWSVNSLCHFLGRRPFPTSDQSRNLAALALPTMGEAWHNNHHAFPRSAFHGLRWWQIDISGLVIRLMERTGLAWEVVRIDPERQAQKAAA